MTHPSRQNRQRKAERERPPPPPLHTHTHARARARARAQVHINEMMKRKAELSDLSVSKGESWLADLSADQIGDIFSPAAATGADDAMDEDDY